MESPNIFWGATNGIDPSHFENYSSFQVITDKAEYSTPAKLPATSNSSLAIGKLTHITREPNTVRDLKYVLKQRYETSRALVIGMNNSGQTRIFSDYPGFPSALVLTNIGP